jgi:hypothetical protein
MRHKTGPWKPWKNKLRFSTVPTAPAAADNSRSKAADPKPHAIVYTKDLTLPLPCGKPPAFREIAI